MEHNNRIKGIKGFRDKLADVSKIKGIHVTSHVSEDGEMPPELDELLDNIPDGVQALPIMDGPLEGSPFEGVTDVLDFNEKARTLVKSICLQNDGMRPVFAIITDDDQLLIGSPMKFDGTNDKDLMAMAIKQICKQVDARAVAFASEVWFLSMDKDDPNAHDIINKGGSISENPERVEGIGVFTEWKGETPSMSIMQIIRDEEDKIKTIIERDEMMNTKADSAIGRFSNFLGN